MKIPGMESTSITAIIRGLWKDPSGIGWVWVLPGIIRSVKNYVSGICCLLIRIIQRNLLMEISVNIRKLIPTKEPMMRWDAVLNACLTERLTRYLMLHWIMSIKVRALPSMTILILNGILSKEYGWPGVLPIPTGRPIVMSLYRQNRVSLKISRMIKIKDPTIIVAVRPILWMEILWWMPGNLSISICLPWC